MRFKIVLKNDILKLKNLKNKFLSQFTRNTNKKKYNHQNDKRHENLKI